MAIVLTEAGGTGGHEPVEFSYGIAHTLGPLDQGFLAAPLQRYACAVFFLDVAALV